MLQEKQQDQTEKKNRIPIIRERLLELQGNLSNVDFAKKLGLSRQTVGFYINGDRIPDAETLKKICQCCNVSADYILGLSEDPAIDNCAVDELDLTPRYIGAITRRKSQDNPLQWAITRRILETAELKIAAAVYDCVIAKNAYDEYKRVFMMYDKEQSDHFCFGPDAKYNIIHKKTAEEIAKKMDSGEYSLELMQNLSRQIRYSDEESLITPSVADMARLRLMDVIDGILKFLGEDEKVKSLLGLSEPPKYEITYDEEMTRNAEEYKKQQSGTMF